MAEKSGVISLEDLEARLDLLDGRIARLEKAGLARVSGDFEIWMEKKVRDGAGKYYDYAEGLKKTVLPQCMGKDLEGCKAVFYRERDKLMELRKIAADKAKAEGSVAPT